MRNALGRLTSFYGANPLHLLALLGCFALAGYAALQIVSDPSLPRIIMWFAAAIVAHDLILFPLYALADRSLSGLLRRERRSRAETIAPPLVNYIRMPVLSSGLLLLVFLPGIIQQGQSTYLAATGLTQQPYLARWLLLTAALFGLSAVLYAARLGRAYRHHPGHRSTPAEPPP